ncbi:MAG: glyoxylate/hydroxypyruvate reductase A [Paracoccaceae bacterium]|nr:glyoxylate/hydroxypyruvate reductase A [Paracoccaceae bacterium]
MTINILFSASSEAWDRYEQPLRAQLDMLKIQYQLEPDLAADIVDYIVYAPNSELVEFSPYTRCKAVLNLWAGVENITSNTTLNIPLARMVDHGLSQGMVEWVVGHVMRHHLGIDLQINDQDGVWRPHAAPLAEDRIVTFLGLGVLGTSSGQALRQLGFKVRGWSKRKKSVDGIKCYHGDDELKDALSGADFVILLLPDTPETKNTLNRDTLGHLKKGAFVINPGRGSLIDDEALLMSLDSGHIAHATLDVFRIEPLPEAHPFWSHPKVTVTPHIAAPTRPECSAPVIVENIRRGENGESFLHLVDRQSGY